MNRHRLVHVTEFHYDGLVYDSYNVLRLRPRDDDSQSCLSFKLQTEPDARASAYVDHWGNWVHGFNVLAQHRVLRVEARSVVQVSPPPPMPAQGLTLPAFDAMRNELDEHFDFLAPTDYVPQPQTLQSLVDLAEQGSDGTVAGFARSAAALVHDRFQYAKGATHVQSTVLDALATGAGVCQDFAHVLLAIARMRGIPARYVSGYLMPALDGPTGSGEDVVGGHASHAWMEILLPGYGWIGMDPTQGQPAGARHVRVAYGRDYADVAPVRGVYKGHAGQHLFVDVGVRPALDDDGKEYLEETAAAPPQAPPQDSAPEQDQQQQQQQQ